MEKDKIHNWLEKYFNATSKYTLQDWHIALEKRIGIYNELINFNSRKRKFSLNPSRRRSSVEDEYCMSMLGYAPRLHPWEEILACIPLDHNIHEIDNTPNVIERTFSKTTKKTRFPVVKFDTKSGVIVFKLPDGKYHSYSSQLTLDPFAFFKFKQIEHAMNSLYHEKYSTLYSMVEEIKSGEILKITVSDEKLIYERDRENYQKLKSITEKNKTLRPLSTHNFILHLSSYDKDVKKLLEKIPHKMSLEYNENIPIARIPPEGVYSHTIPYNWENSTLKKTAWYEIDLTKSEKEIIREMKENIRALKKLYSINDKTNHLSDTDDFDRKKEPETLYELCVLIYIDFAILRFALKIEKTENFIDEKIEVFVSSRSKKLKKPHINNVKRKINQIMTNEYLNHMRSKILQEKPNTISQ